MRGYVSGKMSGEPEFNFPRFHRTAATLRALGFDIVNPAEHFGGAVDIPGGWGTYLRFDVSVLCGCQVMFVIPGWEESRGARVEVGVALALGMPILDADTQRPLVPQPRMLLSLDGEAPVVLGG